MDLNNELQETVKSLQKQLEESKFKDSQLRAKEEILIRLQAKVKDLECKGNAGRIKEIESDKITQELAAKETENKLLKAQLIELEKAFKQKDKLAREDSQKLQTISNASLDTYKREAENRYNEVQTQLNV